MDTYSDLPGMMPVLILEVLCPVRGNVSVLGKPKLLVTLVVMLASAHAPSRVSLFFSYLDVERCYFPSSFTEHICGNNTNFWPERV